MKFLTRTIGVATILAMAQTENAQNANAAETPQVVAPKSATVPQTFSQSKADLFSLDYTDVPIAEILKMIGYETKVRILVGDDVIGKLPQIKLEDVTAERALRVIAEMAKVSFHKIDDRTFALGQNAARELTSATLISIQGSGRFITSVEIKNAWAPEVLQQLAEKADVKIVFATKHQPTIKNFKLEGVSVDTALRAVAAAAGLDCVPMHRFLKNGEKEFVGYSVDWSLPDPIMERYLSKHNDETRPPYQPRYRAIPPFLRSDEPPRETDNLEELDPMIVKPPADRKYHGLIPFQPKTAPPIQNDENAPERNSK